MAMWRRNWVHISFKNKLVPWPVAWIFYQNLLKICFFFILLLKQTKWAENIQSLEEIIRSSEEKHTLKAGKSGNKPYDQLVSANYNLVSPAALSKAVPSFFSFKDLIILQNHMLFNLRKKLYSKEKQQNILCMQKVFCIFFQAPTHKHAKQKVWLKCIWYFNIFYC